MRPSDFLSDADWAALWARLRLSPRERVIARLIVDDATEEAMADELGIAMPTVHTHLARLYRKVGVSGRCQVLTRVFREYGDRQRPQRTPRSNAPQGLARGCRLYG